MDELAFNTHPRHAYARDVSSLVPRRIVWECVRTSNVTVWERAFEVASAKVFNGPPSRWWIQYYGASTATTTPHSLIQST